MADMSTHEMLDDVNLAILDDEAAGAFAVAGYVNGDTANWPAIVAKYGRSGKFLLSIDVQANPSVGAQCLDIERFDATIGQAPGWARATQFAGKAAKDLRWYPKLYCSAGNGASLIATMTAAGIPRDEYMWWSAHYDWEGGAHICGPSSCGFPQADATQYTSTFQGASLDASMCFGYFFAGPPAAPVKPVEPPVKPPKPVVPLLASAWHPSAVLTEGSTGDAVKVLQIMLRNSGLEGVRGIAVDGDFAVDGQTLTAVRNFQAAKLLFVDGKAGPKTHAALVALGDFDGPKPVAAVIVEPAPVVAPVQPVEAPVEPVEPVVVSVDPEPVTPVSVAPEVVPEPAVVPDVLVYIQNILDPAMASKLGLPTGTILFIPHMVQGA